MRITRSFAFHTKYLSKRIITISILAIATIAGLSSLSLVLQPTKQASAITPPDNCFAFNSATGTITAYYPYEDNSSANPVCPKDVDIPSQIGGVTVTEIGSNAFYDKQLTSVTIPDTVASIGAVAFNLNQLSAITIPNSVVTVGHSAFSDSKISTVVILNPATTMQHSSFANNPVSSMTIGSSSYTEQTPTTNPACFAVSGTTITDYYQTSPLVARNSGVLCGRNVVIPSSVTVIGNSAFSSNQLIKVDIPNSIVSIGSSAFAYNQLTTVDIPNSVTSIDNYSFSNNQLEKVSLSSSITSIGNRVFTANRLTAVSIPSSVASIYHSAFILQSQWGGDIDNYSAAATNAPSIYSYSPVIIQQAYDSIWYVKLILEDPSNPHGLVDGIVSEAWYSGDDYNENGHQNDSLGGHLINPATLSLDYVDQVNRGLQASQVFTGQLPDATYINSYFASHGPMLPEVDDPYDLTPAEEQSIQNAFSAYYRIGDTVTITPLAIDGYITPQTRTFVLGSATNNESYIYTQTSDGSVGQAGEGSDGQLAETGMSMDNLLVTAGLLTATSLAFLARRRL